MQNMLSQLTDPLKKMEEMNRVSEDEEKRIQELNARLSQIKLM